MNGKNFTEVVDLIIKEDGRYHKGVYFFIRKALDHTLKHLKKDLDIQGKGTRHVSGAELLEGIRQYALKQFGPLARTVLLHWGVTKCSDFGDIVFNLVDFGVFGKTEHDNREDFSDGYEFGETFEKPFLPERLRNSDKVEDASDGGENRS